MADNTPYNLYDVPAKYYDVMINDILQAKKYVYLEIYKYYNDEIGDRFRDALTTIARKGVEVKLLIDSWDGRDASGRRAAAGVYFLRLESGGMTQTRKITVVR